MLQKLKSLIADDTLYFAALLLVISVASFGLGRQSVVQQGAQSGQKGSSSVVVTPPASVPTPTTTIQAPSNSQPAAIISSVGGGVVASKSGTKYHLPTCSGAKSIKPDNLISFETIEAAKAAGYTPAANCPGLQ